MTNWDRYNFDNYINQGRKIIVITKTNTTTYLRSQCKLINGKMFVIRFVLWEDFNSKKSLSEWHTRKTDAMQCKLALDQFMEESLVMEM